jgi:hypothetical protein
MHLGRDGSGCPALHRWRESVLLEGEEPRRPTWEERVGEMDEESRKSFGPLVSSFLSTRQRQVFFLHHGIVDNRPIKHKLIAKKLDLSEAEVDEIFYQAEVTIRNTIKKLTDLVEGRPEEVRKAALHIWPVQ